MTDDEITIETLSWRDAKAAVRPLREQVFMDELGVKPREEWDGHDAQATHFTASVDGDAVGCARLITAGQHCGKIGRLAVIKPLRGRGIGTALLQGAVDYARDNEFSETFLDAQVQALPFYARFGFIGEGDPFIDAGMVHQRMRLPLPPSTGVDRIDGPADALVSLVTQTLESRRTLDILSSQLGLAPYGDTGLVDAISALARGNSRSRIRILAQDTRPLQGLTHPLVDLAQRLPSRIALRGLREMPKNPDVGYLIGDRERLVYFNQENELRGFVDTQGRAESRRLLEEFDHLWELYSFTDPNLQRLYL